MSIVEPAGITGTHTADLILGPDATQQQWEETRARGLGGSDIGAATGLNPYRSPYALWCDKRGMAPADVPDDDAADRMRWGHLLEPVLRGEFARRHPELVVTGPPGTFVHKTHRWMIANPDGLCLDRRSREPSAIFEAKLAGSRQAYKWDHDRMPSEYLAQVTWYMIIMGVTRAHVAVLIDSHTYVERVVDLDEDFAGNLTLVGKEVWDQVLNGDPPDVDAAESTRRALAHMPSDGTEIELGTEWDTALARRAELTNIIKDAYAERDGIDNRLRKALGPAEAATRDGQLIARHRAPSQPSRTCRYDALASEQPAIYRQYVTEREPSRRLTYHNTHPKGDNA